MEMSKTKLALLQELERRVEDKVLEPSNAELISKLIEHADNDDEALAIAALGTTYKRTGFHFDKRLEHQREDIHYLRRNEGLSFQTDPARPTHKLIIGDNYDALQNLLISYRGKVNVIYIDPPYGKDSMGEFAQTNYENAITRDNLLSMLYPRLQMAKELLADDGVIFCSIDDKNQAYVKCLFDEVFEERNFIASMPKKGTGGRQDSTHYAMVHEYLLCYAKNSENYVSGRQEHSKDYPLFDEERQLHYKTQLLRKWGDNSRREDRPNLYYPIYYNEQRNLIALERQGKDDIEIFPMLDAEEEGCWRWGKGTMKEALEGKLVEIKYTRQKGYVPYEKQYEELNEEGKKLYSSWIDDIGNSTGVKLLKTIVSAKSFKYPKAVDYIERILQMSSERDDITVLDFFAGSGTTGQAVLELNKRDGGKRQFILCQANEQTETTPNGIAYDVTSKRLKRVMTGECYDGSRDFRWREENEPYGDNLDVYEIESVSPSNAVEGRTPFEVIDERLYGKEKFESLKEKVEWVCENFAHARQQVEGDEQWRAKIEKGGRDAARG